MSETAVIDRTPADDEQDSLLIFAWAAGCSTPPLLMNPPPAWTVKFFTKLGQRNLYVKLPGTVSAYRFSDGTKLDPSSTLGDLGLLPYEMIEFRSDAD